MSKYTTQVRYICEHLAQYTPPEDFVTDYDYNTVLSEAVTKKIFGDPTSQTDFTYPIFGDDNDKRYELNRKILEHFFTREIGYETYGLWKQKLRFKMREIMPKYNKLYESETLMYSNGALSIDVFNNVDLKTDRNTVNAGNEVNSVDKENTKKSKENRAANTSNNTESETESQAKQNGNSINTESNSRADMQKYSDTPQSTIDASGQVNFDLDSYATNATKNNADEERSVAASNINASDGKSKLSENVNGSKTESNNTDEDQTTKENSNKSISGLEKYLETMKGKTGDKSYAKMLEEYRHSIINIDLMIIKELEDLFMGVW